MLKYVMSNTVLYCSNAYCITCILTQSIQASCFLDKFIAEIFLWSSVNVFRNLYAKTPLVFVSFSFSRMFNPRYWVDGLSA